MGKIFEPAVQGASVLISLSERAAATAAAAASGGWFGARLLLC
jgi:hypothetical protein